MALAFTKALRDVFAEFDASSNPREIQRSEFERAMREIEAYLAVSVLASGSVIIKSTLAELNADLAHDPDTIGFVYEDDSQRIYQKIGDSGNGSWKFLQSFQTVQGETGNPGAQGIPGQNAIATTYSDFGAPDNSLGADDETYTDLNNQDVYEKQSGEWVLRSSSQRLIIDSFPAGAQIIEQSPTTPDELKKISKKSVAAFFDLDNGVVIDKGVPGNESDGTISSFLTTERSTAKLAFDATRELASSAIDVEAFQHEGGSPSGLAIGDNVANLQRYSNDPENWRQDTRLLFTTSSDRLFSGEDSVKVAPSTVSGTHQLQEDAPDSTSGEDYHFDIILKADGYNIVQVYMPQEVFRTGTGYPTVKLDLRNGGLQDIADEITALPTKSLGNGWWRFSFYGTAIDTITAPNMIVRILEDDETSSYAGDGTDGILWGNFQITEGNRPRTIIKTGATASSGDIGDDRVSKAFPAGFFSEGLTIDLAFQDYQKATNDVLFEFTDGTNYIEFNQDNENGVFELTSDFGTAKTITAIQPIYEDVLTEAKFYITKDPYGFDLMSFYINGHKQGQVDITGVDFSGVWTAYYGRDAVSVGRMANFTLKRAILSGEILPTPTPVLDSIAAVGPSVTFDDVNGVALEQFYPHIVGRALGKNVAVDNFGVSGENSMQVLIDQLPLALARKPKLAFIDFANFTTATITGTPTDSSITLSDATKFRAGASILIPVSGTKYSRKISTLVGNVATLESTLPSAPVTGATVEEDVTQNIADTATAFRNIGAIVICKGFAFQNHDGGVAQDTTSAEGSRSEERALVKAAVTLAGSGVYYSDGYENFKQRILDSLETANDNSGHVASQDVHHDAYGQRWQKAEPDLAVLRTLGYQV